jgi:tRNA (cmo5U34)-methyltransferase
MGLVMADSVSKFDSDRAGEYAQQSRIALAGYEACHELAACLLSAIISASSPARILVVGAGGTAQEIVAASKLAPEWSFIAVDPSEPMLELAKASLESKGLASRVTFHLGYVSDLPSKEKFDAATLIGVIHHLNGNDEKKRILTDIAQRLKQRAPFILAGNRYAYASKQIFLSAWSERWRMSGASSDEIEAKRAKILQGADPPASNEAVIELLEKSGFVEAEQFFSSLFWAAWITRLGVKID